MTGKSDFTAEEWELVAQGPASAGLIVVTAQRGGVFRETLALTRGYVEARQAHGQSEPSSTRSSRPSPSSTTLATARRESCASTGCSISVTRLPLLEQKATAEELDSYRRFTVGLAEKVANAHREEGADAVSPKERAALDQITEAVGTSPA